MKLQKDIMAFKFVLHCWIFLPMVLVALSVSIISVMVLMTRQATQTMQDASDGTLQVLLAHVQDRSDLLVHTHASMLNVARAVGSNKNLSSFSEIRNKVAPGLFMAFVALPLVSQISYVGLNGLVLSYYLEDNQNHAIFSNETHASNDTFTSNWYSQIVNPDTGEPYGDVIVLAPPQPNEFQWFFDALKDKSGHTSLGVGWQKSRGQMFFFTALVPNLGVVSLGVGVNDFVSYVSSIDLHGGCLHLAVKNVDFLAQVEASDAYHILGNNTMSEHLIHQSTALSVEEFVKLSCQPNDTTGLDIGTLSTDYLKVWGNKYKLGCTHLDAFGIQLVSILEFPCKTCMPLFQKMKIITVSLVSFMIVGVIVGSYILLQLFIRSQVQEAFLHANLIKHKEAVQQAERKSMNKSLAFASASHDVRTSLAGITGLIELCRENVSPNSELDRSLLQMNACASKLLGILNSVLDISKVEAGKIQLEEVEFDMAQVLEESVDMFHIVAFKKGLEVIWDPCDCSVLRASSVNGDCKRFKQILDNLLGNAVKFTSEGHVVVRAWAKMPCLTNSKLSSEHDCHFPKLFGPLSKCLCKHGDGDSYNDLQTLNGVQHDPKSVEFIFEVDDTGVGIPKEKRASVFENYVQVKESLASGYEGTGLGLGIVQSYVRLMGGEINIQDKELGEGGTCFRFNVFLKSCELCSDTEDGENINNPRATSREPIATQSNSRVPIFKEGLKMEGIHSLLLIDGGETKKILERWMENLGIKVWAIHHSGLLHPTLKKIKNHLSISEKLDATSLSTSSSKTSHNANIEEDLSGSKDEVGHRLPLFHKDASKKSSRGLSAHILVVIDLSCGDHLEICSILKNFISSTHTICCKIVWLANSNAPTTDLEKLKHGFHCLILQKPCHGSRLYALLRLLQEFEGTDHLFKYGIKDAFYDSELSSKSESSKWSCKIIPQLDHRTHETSKLRLNLEDEKPLSGVNILLVEDTLILRHLATSMLSRLGATIKSVENGLEALDLIKQAFQGEVYSYDGSIQPRGKSKSFPYGVILMDCEMPIMNGYEATKHIRKEEQRYGLHIPIIALTAHATLEEEKKTILSGMDFHLTKPLQTDMLLKVLSSVCQN